MKQLIFISLPALLLASSCSKRNEPALPAIQTATENTLKISVLNYAGAEPLELDTKWYKNENGDSLQIRTFDYFISNMKLMRGDSVVYSEQYSYHLIRQSADSTWNFTIGQIPDGSYNKISFLIGVDAEHNVSGAQTGDLDPNTSMFWSWHTGYIMMKIEGTSPQSLNLNHSITYHFGGYTGPNNVIRNVVLPINIQINSNSKTIHTLYLRSDVLECFKTPNTISISNTSAFMSECEDAKKMADNYADMFSVDHIE